MNETGVEAETRPRSPKARGDGRARACARRPAGPSLLLFGHATWRPAGEPGGAALPQKAFVLVALLHLLFGGQASRPALAARLYEDANQGGALANFRQLMARIQRWQGASNVELVRSVGGDVVLATAAEAPSCDLALFQTLPDPRDGRALAALAELYRGDLLENLSGCGPSLESVVVAHRGRLRERYAGQVLAGAEYVRGAAGEAALRRLVDIDPYREEAWRLLIDLRAESQGIEAARSIYREMRQVFGDDLNAHPEAHITALVSDLRRNAPPRAWAELLPAQRDDPAPPARSERVETAVPRLCLLMPTAPGGDPTRAQLAQALIEDVTLGLCRLRSLAVIAPHTAWHLSDGALPNDRFGIDYFVETAIQTFGDEIRLVLKLVRVSDRRILWAERFAIDAGMPPEHYSTISRSVVLALADGIEQGELESRRPIDKPEAYHLYLTGRHHLRTLDLPALRRARRAFTQAAELSPDFVPALNGVSRTMTLEWLLLARTEKDLLHRAERIAARAVAIDPLSGEALREAANALLFLGGLDEATGKLAEAERLLPHHADILADHSNALTHASQLRPALGRIEQAIQLNPVTPDSYLWKAGGTLFFLERYEDALEHLRRMQTQGPAFRLVAACLVMLGRKADAAHFVRQAMADQPQFNVGAWISAIPMRSNDHTLLYAHALRAAGFT